MHYFSIIHRNCWANNPFCNPIWESNNEENENLLSKLIRKEEKHPSELIYSNIQCILRGNINSEKTFLKDKLGWTLTLTCLFLFALTCYKWGHLCKHVIAFYTSCKGRGYRNNGTSEKAICRKCTGTAWVSDDVERMVVT